SIEASARSKSASTAASTPEASPASVRTDRLCDGSEETSSSRTPGTLRTASAIDVTTSARCPSLTLGMHSITMNGVDSSARRCTSANQAVIIAAGFALFMSDPLRTDGARAHDFESAQDRDAKIEQLLLLGLDHYFAARYELAINVWTRALFLDRSHARARAYIERARSALAERQRESEELLQNGVAAFQRGEADEARRLLQAAIRAGGPPAEAARAPGRVDTR